LRMIRRMGEWRCRKEGARARGCENTYAERARGRGRWRRWGRGGAGAGGKH
jgi:hypothetical protein